METQEQYTDLATRHNEGKLRWSLVDFKSLEPMVRVLEFGAEKYSAENWRQGLKVSGLLDSCYRHLGDLLKGKTLDDESGQPITGHLQCNLMFLQWMLDNRPDLDDRDNSLVSRLSKLLEDSESDNEITVNNLVNGFCDAHSAAHQELVDMGGHHVPNIEKST